MSDDPADNTPAPPAESEVICPERDWESPLVGYSYCVKPPNHEGDHDFRYDATD